MTRKKQQRINLDEHEGRKFVSDNLYSLYQVLEKDYAKQGGPWGFKNRAFEMHDGRSTHGEKGEPDFICGDVEIWWYKHIGRSMEINRDMTLDELDTMFLRCRKSLRKKKHRVIVSVLW